MRKKVLGLLFMFCAFGFFKATAQEFSPFMSSPYAGITAGKLNPASLAGSRYKFDVTVLGVSGGVHNNLLTFPTSSIFKSVFDGTFWKNIGDFKELNIPSEVRSAITGDYLPKFNVPDWESGPYGGNANGQLDILNLMYAFNDRFSLAAGYSYRFQASASGIPKEASS
ncbi:MAG: hypothetical protein LBK97_06235, partial [Prevotellaceae bacterium]|nr:hypothetical protein [Prevotellaceae bacterium]